MIFEISVNVLFWVNFLPEVENKVLKMSSIIFLKLWSNFRIVEGDTLFFTRLRIRRLINLFKISILLSDKKHLPVLLKIDAKIGFIRFLVRR
jgi:hypothetical protein